MDKTSMWLDFAKVDEDSAELVIGINNAQPDSYVKISNLIVENGGKLVNTVSAKGEVIAVVADLPLDLVPSFVKDVQASNLARYIEPNMKYQTQLVPNDPYWNLQWGPQKIEADYAWNTTIGDPSVLVAVIDTGIDWDHPDLAANYVALGYDWVNNDTDPMDDHGHGTHVAGIIAAVLDNSIGIAGLAQVSIMAEKSIDQYGWGYEDDLANAIIHAVDQGADILSNSWGEYGESSLIYEAVKYAYNAGVLVVAAAGNEAWDVKLYPAAYDEVVAVTATDEFDNPAGFTNFGDWVELAAPGVNIFSTVWDNSYISKSGTSMSTPHVSGVAALIWSQFPNVSRDWVRLWLRYTADDLGDPGFDSYHGYGRINARKAVEETPPDHDVVVLSWQIPPYVEPGGLTTVNSTILNFGASDESNMTVQLLINGSIADSASIGFLTSGTSATVSFSWSPTVEGVYNVTSYVVPVPGETLIENNVISAYIYVGFPLKVFVLDSAGTDLYTTTWEILSTNWPTFGDTLIYIDYTTLNIDDITYDDIAATGADVLIISCAYDWEFTDSEIDAITRYVLEGHGLIATAGTLYYWVPNNNKLAPLFGLNETITWNATGTDLLHIEEPTHPLFRNILTPFIFPYVGTAIPSDGRWDSNELIGGTYLALGHYEESAIVAYRGLVYISPWLEIIPAYYHFNLQLLYNAITWSRYQKPEHELIVSLDSPAALKPGESTLLNATVSNMGLSNETDVELFLFIDGAEVNSTTIPQLVNGTSYTIRYLWTPTAEAAYNVTAYAPPVLGEDNILNNVKSKRVIASNLVVALFKNVDPWTYPANEEALSFYGIPYVVFRSSDFGAVNLSTFTKVAIASDQDQTFYNAMNIYRWWFEDYVSSGGVLEIHAADWGWNGGGWVGPLPGGLIWYSYYADYVTIVDPMHPVVTAPNPITDAELDGWSASVHGYFDTYPADSRIVIIEDLSGYPAYLEFDYGAGVIVASSQTLEWAYWHWYSLILENSLLYTPIKYPHELAVTLEAPAFLEPGESSLLNATVFNRGLSNETSVDLFLLINGTEVNNITIPELVNGISYTIDYHWTPTIEATYNVTAYAPPVPDENVTANNIMSKMVYVRYVDVALISDHSELLAITPILDSMGVGYDIYNDNSMYLYTEDPSLLLDYPAVIFYTDYRHITSAEYSALESYLSSGGNLLVTGFDSLVGDYLLADLVRSSSYGDNMGEPDLFVVDASHPIMNGPYGNFPAGYHISGLYSDNDAAEADTARNAVTIAELADGHDKIIATDGLLGKIVFWNGVGPNDWMWNADCEAMFKNMLVWFIIQYEHELTVSLDASPFLETGDSSLLNATVHNRGLSNETDVELFLLINGITVDNAIVPELLTGSSFTLSYLWTPTLGGTYNVTAYAPPVPGENVTANNVASVIVNVVRPAILSVQPPTSGAAVSETFSINITIADVTDMWGYEFILSYNTSILTATGYASYDPFNMKWAAIIDDAVGVVGMSYSMPLGVPPGEGFSTVEPAPIARIGFTVDATGASLLDLHDTILTDPATNEILHEAVGGYFATIVHDIAVTNVTLSKTVVGQGYSMPINVTVANQGDFTETFNVTVYADQNATIIGDEITIATRNVTLTSRNSTIVTFTWDTTDMPYGDYTISAVATPVPGETDTTDNTFIDGTVLVTIPGDINGDGTVNILDAGLISAHWYPGPPIGPLGYNPVADINNDGSVNIVDAAIISANWGQFW